MAGSGRPYPHPVLPSEIAAIEAERCGPYRDAFGLCTGCGLRGRIQRRCTADDPDRACESIRAPTLSPGSGCRARTPAATSASRRSARAPCTDWSRT
ncbi:hypothetical protein [Streptomyces sp. NPDC002619]|uniref:hypothetical protein n=1 Tax=Streptomyces sp. NPDC002619 TaxID=3364655 RepID=UPI0036A8D381